MKNLKKSSGMSCLKVNSVHETLSTKKKHVSVYVCYAKNFIKEIWFSILRQYVLHDVSRKEEKFILEMRLALLYRTQEWKDFCIKNEWKEASRLEPLHAYRTCERKATHAIEKWLELWLRSHSFPFLVSSVDFKHPRVRWRVLENLLSETKHTTRGNKRNKWVNKKRIFVQNGMLVYETENLC